MIIRHDLRIVFLHVPKCAGKELREVFLEGTTPDNHENFFNFSYSTHLHRHVDLAHLPMDDLVHFSANKWLEEYTVIAAIRNPYERLRSAINEYYRQYSKSDEAITNSLGPSTSMRSAYLNELPLRHELRDPRFIHSLPITRFTHYGADAKVDHLLRCESLRSDFLSLAEMLKLPDSISRRARQQLRNQPVAALDQLKPSASRDEIHMANLLYAQDFQTFGYQIHPEVSEAIDPVSSSITSLTPVENHSHSIDLIARAQQIRWHWGPSSQRVEPACLEPIRPRRKQ